MKNAEKMKAELKDEMKMIEGMNETERKIYFINKKNEAAHYCARIKRQQNIILMVVVVIVFILVIIYKVTNKDEKEKGNDKPNIEIIDDR